jgi:hypothetical protein
MNNIERIPEAAECTLGNLVMCTCHLKDIEDVDAFDASTPSTFRVNAPPVPLFSLCWEKA